MSEALRYNEAPRACQRCDFGADLATPGAACRHPDVVGRSQRVEAAAARRLGGACGPDAKYLTIQGDSLDPTIRSAGQR